MKRLNALQAYNAMIKFLESCYSEKLGLVGVLLGALKFWDDNGPMDMVLWEKWISILGTDKNIGEEQSYRAMLQFLDDYFRWYTSENIERRFEKLKFSKKGTIILSTELDDYIEAESIYRWKKKLQFVNGSIDSEIWSKWLKIVGEVLNEPEGTKYYIEPVA